MNATITKVYPEPRTWEGNYGPSAAVKVDFADGSSGEYVTKPDKAQSHIERLQALIGKPSDFEVDASKQKEWQGVIQHRIKGYPGKPEAPQGGGGGGGRQYIPAFRDTEEGERFIQERMDRRTAVMQSIQWCGVQASPVDVKINADFIYEWLRASASVPAAPQTATPVSTPETGQNASDEASGRQNGQGKKPLTPEEAACRDGMRWLKGWAEVNDLPSEKAFLLKVVAEALDDFNVSDLRNVKAAGWQVVKEHCQSLTDEDILGWQAVATNAVGAKA